MVMNLSSRLPGLFKGPVRDLSSVYCERQPTTSRRADDVEQRLTLLLDHHVAGAGQRSGELRRLLDPLAMTALCLDRRFERRARRQVRHEAAAVLAGDAVLEHRHGGAAHRAIEAVVEDDG